MKPECVQQACDLFSTARREVRTLDVLPARCRPESYADAYQIQAAFIADWPDDVIGWKVGATNPPALTLFGVEEPFLGPIFSETVFFSPAKLPAAAFQHFCLESEFAFRIATPPTPRTEPYSHDELRDTISEVIPVFELICPRFSEIPKGDGLGAIADCGVGGGIVLGKPERDLAGLDLANHIVRFSVDGNEIARGTGAMVMNNPLNALAWAVAKLSGLGVALRAGQLITTGTCTGVNFVEVGQDACADFMSLGSVNARFV